MNDRQVPGVWEAKLDGKSWKVLDENGKLIATIADTVDAEAKVKLITVTPYILEALKAMVELIGDEDLPDNGELSGAAVCDMARSAIELATIL
ncbi:hypothetical protein ACFLUY_01400 [Chloroflexota bacterium]